MERRPLGEATNIGACVTFKCPDDEFVELAGAHAELEQELAAERQKTAVLKLEVLELQQQNEVMKRHVLGFQLATGFATAPFAIERRDDAIVEGVTRRTARVMRTVPLALAVPPAEQQSWPGHLDPVAWAPHLERMSRQLMLRDQVRDLQELVQRLARGVHRQLALRAHCDGAEYVSAPWLKELKPIEVPTSLAKAFKVLIIACDFKRVSDSHSHGRMLMTHRKILCLR